MYFRIVGKAIAASFIFSSLMSCALAGQMNLKKYKLDSLYDGETLQESSLDSVVSQIQPGTIIVLSEYHASDTDRDGKVDYDEHQKKQLLFLKKLKQLNPGKKINVGKEFIYYTYNKEIQDYLDDKLNDQEFIKAIGWGGNTFNSYKPVLRFPKQTGGVTRGINLDRAISGKIGKKGLKSLTPDELKMLPPNFEVGRDEYKDRFVKLMGGSGHLAPDLIDNYFTAQSSWDDTMAYQSLEYMKNRPDEFFVIIVGDFHNKFGGGLPDRLKARGAQLLFTISQESAGSRTDTEMTKEIEKDSNGEIRADYIWISK